MTLQKRHKDVLKFLVFMLFVMLVVFYFVDRAQRSLIRNKALTVGKVQSMERFPRSSDIRVWYTYIVDDKQLKDQYRLHVNNRFRPQIEQLISNRKMPIVYDTTNPSNCDFPLLEKDFQKYRLAKPDSLLDVYRVIDSLAFFKD